MKTHTTNYQNTFIEIAEDCAATEGEMPPAKAAKTVANLEFDLLYNNPYKYTSDDVLFSVFSTRKEVAPPEMEEQREQFFSKGQPCFRASALTKKYGWGVHCNAEGKVAIYSVGSEEYQKFLTDDSIKKVKAMRSKKA